MSDENRYTVEQLDAVKKVNKKKDYYDILGVPKDCSDDDLKKAYKKLALKLHPDKNHAPGATEAFKSVNKAFSALSDPNEKKKYDNGWEDEEVASPFSDVRFSFDGYHFTSEDLFTDDVFSMFFGQNASNCRNRQSSTRNGRKKRTSTSQQHQQQHDHPRRQGQRQSFTNNVNHNNRDRQQGSNFLNSYNFLVQMSPLLIMIFLSLMNTFFSYEDVYTLQPDSKYSVEMQTGRLNLPYFLKVDFKEKYPGHLENVERQVEEDHVVMLKNKCTKEKNIKESILWRAKMYNNKQLYDQTKDRKLPSCDLLRSLVARY